MVARIESTRQPEGRVYDVGAPTVHGVIAKAGPQVSLVKWDVPEPWGKEGYVINKYLRPVRDGRKVR